MPPQPYLGTCIKNVKDFKERNTQMVISKNLGITCAPCGVCKVHEMLL